MTCLHIVHRLVEIVVLISTQRTCRTQCESPTELYKDRREIVRSQDWATREDYATLTSKGRKLDTQSFPDKKAEDTVFGREENQTDGLLKGIKPDTQSFEGKRAKHTVFGWGAPPERYVLGVAVPDTQSAEATVMLSRLRFFSLAIFRASG